MWSWMKILRVTCSPHQKKPFPRKLQWSGITAFRMGKQEKFPWKFFWSRERCSVNPIKSLLCGKNMAHSVVQIIGLILGGVGMILTCVVTGMPQWRISIVLENNCQNLQKRIDATWISRWEGLWVTCISQGKFQMHCNNYDSMVSITPDLKSGRVLMIFAIVLSIFAFLTAIVGMLYKRHSEQSTNGKNCLLLASGIGYILAAVLVLIPVSWTTHNIIREAYNPMCTARQELGEAIFLGWPTILILLLSGSILCWFYPRVDSSNGSEYSAPTHQQDQELYQIDDRSSCHQSISQYI
uniref:Claudin-8-like n=1 Tax=Geotrypetes seraphini TaxID=260995 RepID=A0A6P8QUL1_GEOSA|nr:claudin-8-like [Geotrypetes seraphini]